MNSSPCPLLCFAKKGAQLIVYEQYPPLYEVERGKRRG